MCIIPPIVTDGVPVSLSCDSAVQKRRNGSRSCLERRLRTADARHIVLDGGYNPPMTRGREVREILPII